MKRLFLQFAKETDLPYQTFIRINGTYTPPPPPPPKPWYLKLWLLIIAFFGFGKKKFVEPIIPETIADLSIAFNQWRTIKWNTGRYRGWLQRYRPQRYPFGDRVTKFEVRKWTEQLYGKINKISARLATSADAERYKEPSIQENDIIYEANQ